MRAASELHRALAADVWDYRHCRSDYEQECPGQPEGRENAQTLDCNTRQRQSQRTQRTWKEAAGADNPAFQLIGNEFQAMTEVGDILNRICEAGAKLNRTEYW